MAPTPVGVGLVGCGWIAEIAHLPAILRSRAGHLVAVAESNPDRRAWLQPRVPGVRLFENWEALLREPSVKAVVLAVPTALHAKAASDAFAARKHVYLEKPLAVNLDEGRLVVEEWRRAGTIGAIGYNFRRNPILQSALRSLAAGTLGPLVGIQGSFQWAADRLEGWRARPGEGGGVLLDLVSHHADLVAVLTGQRIVQAQCTLRSLRTADDTAAVQLLTADGITAQLSASFAAGAQVNRLELVGRRGVLRVNLLDGHPARIERPAGRGARLIRALDALGQMHPARLLRSPGSEPSFGLALEAFLEAARDGRDVSPDLADGLHALAVVEAAWTSARAGGIPVPVAS